MKKNKKLKILMENMAEEQLFQTWFGFSIYDKVNNKFMSPHGTIASIDSTGKLINIIIKRSTNEK